MTDRTLRVLLVEGWWHGSHRRWAEGYRQASRHTVDLVTGTEDGWRWLLRAGAIGLAERVVAHIEAHGHPDVIVISGTVDVGHLLGLTHRTLGRPGRPVPPVVVYQHESQVVFPTTRSDGGEAALRNLVSWAAADLVLFNSAFHREAVVAALPAMIERWPRATPRPDLDRLAARFEVVPIGLDLTSWARPLRGRRDRDGPPVVLWPHRWERDKDPEAFARAVAKLVDDGVPFRLILAGEEPAAGSEYAVGVRAGLADRFADRVVATGPFDRDRYRALLGLADVVVSCAHHEFFGMAVVEAIAAGCRPVLPADLSYPGLLPDRWHDRVLYRRGRFGTALRDAVAEVATVGHRPAVDGLAEAMDRFDWDTVADLYDDRLEALALSGC